ncbi:MAG: PAAR domain-containing protein, partial [Beijerinckiaceae bacterium]
MNVLIGKKPAWRGLPLAAVAGLQAAKATSDAAVQAAEAAEVAAMGTPGAPAATAAKFAAYAAATTAMTAAINGITATPTPSGGITDKHICAGFVPAPPPHGVGVVIDGSANVLINGLPACTMGDKVLEALGPLNIIVAGEFTVIIGEVGATPLVAPVPGVAAYATADEAARAALALANPQSIAANTEFGGNIFQDPVTGKFGFTMTPGTGTSL